METDKGQSKADIGKLKIIWNITDHCGFHCDICATHSDRIELGFEQKKAVLQSIAALGKKNIKELDFSGGDPLYHPESTQIIREGIALLGKEKVCVTTTGLGITSASARGESLQELLYNCEVTIESAESVPDNIRKEHTYAAKNRLAAARNKDKINTLYVNVPIVDPAMSDEAIHDLVCAITGVQAKNIKVSLIRLMNVGKLDPVKYPPDYSPDRFVSTFTKYAEGTLIRDVHIQCALRGKLFGSACNMLTEKVGIDCAGNVFACAWSGYLKGFSRENIEKNPCYLGNLLDQSLPEILTSERALSLRQKIQEHPTCQCRVFCFREGDNDSIFCDQDPLFGEK